MTPEATEALNAVSAKLITDNLKEMVKRVEVDKEDAGDRGRGVPQRAGVEVEAGRVGRHGRAPRSVYSATAPASQGEAR